ncbi:copper homeostasis protein CutC [Glutamicibacter endophyticus]|uniref:copper homeostasis protein CutC n=1 Tax=Glutamicibacter endophyticus TaxID=1522174 RepID=UPI003AF1B18D
MAPLCLEIVATSGRCAERATAAGADRVEACQALELGGLTPSLEVLELILEHAPARGVHALLRHRPGNFHYDAEDRAVLVAQARSLARSGVHGLVLGALDASGAVDSHCLQEVTAAAFEVNPELEITFHRAIDEATDPLAILDSLFALPVDRVLTSGGKESAVDGLAMIGRLATRSAGQIQIMAGGGMTAEAIAQAAAYGASAVHFSAKQPWAGTIGVDAEMVGLLRQSVDRTMSAAAQLTSEETS